MFTIVNADILYHKYGNKYNGTFNGINESGNIKFQVTNGKVAEFSTESKKKITDDNKRIIWPNEEQLGISPVTEKVINIPRKSSQFSCKENLGIGMEFTLISSMLFDKASVEIGGLSIYIPFEATPNIRLEPQFSLSSYSTTSEDSASSITEKQTNNRYDIRIYYLTKFDKTNIYIGGFISLVKEAITISVSCSDLVNETSKLTFGPSI